MKATLERLMNGQSLSAPEAESLVTQLASGEIAPVIAGALLAALRTRGETPDEIAGFARGMRRLARRPTFDDDPRPAVDIVGTGGDASGSINLSTGASLLAAACGLRIVKHGNRSISSRCGSADVLEALGLPMPLDERAAADCLRQTSFTFLFAPQYHPAMAAIAPVRKALGVRTIFNLLGPLTNPATPPRGIIGAFSPDVARLMAAALASMDIERYFVIHGDGGWDEPTPATAFMLLDVRRGSVAESRRDPAEAGIPRCAPEDLRGGDAAENASGLGTALRGQAGPVQDALVLGAALALEVCDIAPTPRESLILARAAVQDGRAARLLDSLRAFGEQRGVPGA
jgi:anthranilate phosphoribosyltransferase